jgi:hypothetical protein
MDMAQCDPIYPAMHEQLLAFSQNRDETRDRTVPFSLMHAARPRAYHPGRGFAIAYELRKLILEPVGLDSKEPARSSIGYHRKFQS